MWLRIRPITENNNGLEKELIIIKPGAYLLGRGRTRGLEVRNCNVSPEQVESLVQNLVDTSLGTERLPSIYPLVATICSAGSYLSTGTHLNPTRVFDPEVSQNHVLLDLTKPNGRVYDLNSSYGTFLNGQPVISKVDLSEGTSALRLGRKDKIPLLELTYHPEKRMSRAHLKRWFSQFR